MRRLVIIGLLIAMLLISSCSPSEKECEKPFIDSDGKCCLDLDEDGVCDEDQGEEKEAEVEVEETVEEKEESIIEAVPEEPVIEEKEEEPVEETPAEEIIEEISEEVTDEEVQEEKEDTIEDYLARLKEKVPEEPETKMEELLVTFAQDVVGYKYAYNSNWFFVRGDQIKVRLYAAMPLTSVTVDEKYYSLFYYDNVYLDKRELSATGYCEGTDPRVGNRQCVELKIQDVPYPAYYNQYYEKLPEEWLFEYLDKEPVEMGENKYYIRGRQTTKMVFEMGDKFTRMFFDEVTGLPVRVEIVKDDVVEQFYDYQELSANTVRQEDVVHRTASDIPSSEAFYSIYS